MKNNRSFIPVGYKIRSKEVRCIDHNNNNLGVINISEALRIAKDAGLDLVQITPIGNKDIPVCKVLDYGKYKYDLSKKEKEAAKKQRESSIKIKELKFRPNIGDNDLKIKASQAERFINDGDKVKVSVIFKGREMSHTSIGYETLDKFVKLVPGIEIVTKPSMQGRFLSAMYAKKKVSDNN